MAEQDKARQPRRTQPTQAEQQPTADDKGEQARDVLAAHAHGDVPVSDRPAGQSPALDDLPPDDPRREQQVSAREALARAEEANERVQAQMDAEQELGYRGLNPDPTPNDHYTSWGVGRGLPTPETDPDMAAEAHAALFPGAGRFSTTREAREARERARQRRAQDTRRREQAR